jgi:hypothetical protein
VSGHGEVGERPRAATGQGMAHRPQPVPRPHEAGPISPRGKARRRICGAKVSKAGFKTAPERPVAGQGVARHLGPRTRTKRLGGGNRVGEEAKTRPPRVARVVVPGQILALNSLLRSGGYRSSWAGWWRQLDTVAGNTVAAALVAQKEGDWDGEPIDPAVVEVEFHYPDNRRRDPDGSLAHVKGLLDGLVRAGVLVDDSWDHVALSLRRGRPSPLRPYVVVTVRELAANPGSA